MAMGPKGVDADLQRIACPSHINEIVHGRRGVSADTARRLAAYFGTTRLVWLDLQLHVELELEKERFGRWRTL